ncbi:hypothetical protein [Streptomyces chryseus]
MCLPEVAVVPVLGGWVSEHANCSNGNVIDDASDAVRYLSS